MANAERDGTTIAITGLACRLPGDGNNVESFWNSICHGSSAWCEIPRTRFNPDAFSSGTRTRGAHFLKEDISLFDANFFNISHAEACAMDPQQRLMIEVVYEALEGAGYRLQDIAGTATGVFMGQFTSDYKELVYRDPDTALPFSLTGLQAASLSNRISWLFDLRGPSFTLDTACSSSLVAFHLACQSLQYGESEIAIVGGCNLMINPDMFISETGQGFLSPDGKCKAFDISADGYGRGEGFAVLVLRRVESAISHGDPIRAVIRGTGSNQDGHTKGFTLPNGEAQASLIRGVYGRAGLDFGQTGYVEAHGTGTQAGDLEETTALARTIAATLSGDRELVVGSVKSNIGHLEGAAGVASVIKCVMMLETGTIPPNIHFHTPNPAIRFDEWNMKIPTRIMSWPTNGIRRISINSFGYGGSNAHAILDDAYSYLHQRRLDGHHFTMVPKLIGERRLNETAQTLLDQSHPPIHRLFAISAQDKDGIGRVTNTLASFLKKKASQLEIARETDYLSDLAFTLHERRSHLQWKTFCIASSLYELQDMLTSKESTRPEYMSSRKPRLGFVFTGQGAQWANMGIELLKYGAFRDSITAADKYLQQDLNCGWSATEELAKGESTSNIKAALYSQALCTVLQVALVDLLKEWDIVPVAVVGHSSGEIAAAYCLGVLSREDAWKVAYFRGLLSSQLRDMGLEGGMMACGASPGDVTEMISQFAPNDVHIACINSPQSVTVSGDIRGIESLHEALQAKGVFVRKLLVDTAYHSNHMQLVAQEYFEAIADISANSPTGDCNMYSSVSGCVVQPGELGAAYWVRNLISPVQFASAIQHLVHTLELPDFDRTNEKEVDILVEIGPHSALQVPVMESLKAIGLTDVPYYSVLKRHQSAIETALNLAGTLFAAGYLPNFLGINQLARESRTLVDLPPYPWNHSQSHWAESRMAKEYRLREPSQSSLLGTPSPSLVAGERVWRGHIRLSKDPWIADHKIQGLILYPAAGFITMAIEAVSANAETTRKVKRLSLRDIHLISALITPEDSDIEYSVSLRPYLAAARETSYTWTEFTVASSRDGNPFERNCTGLIMIEYDSSNCDEIVLMEEALMVRYREATELCRTAIKLDEFYRALAAVGLQYGPDFRNLVDVMIGLNQSCCTLDIPNIGLRTPQRLHVIHPRTLDAVFHMAFAALIGSSGSITRAMVPKFIHKVVISADIPYGAGVHLRGVANVERHGFDEILADIFVVGAPKSHPVLQVSGLCFAEVVGDSNGNNLRKVPRSICSKLVWRPAINLLRPEEQKGVILTAITALQRRDKTQLKDSAISIAAVLSVLIRLMHHRKPSISISEVVTDANKTQIFLSDFRIADVLKTADYRVWCLDESTERATREAFQASENVPIKLKDLSQTPSKQEKRLDSSDLITIPTILLTTRQFQQILQNAGQLLTSDGRLCLTVPVQQSQDIVALGQAAGLTEWIKFSDFKDPSEQQLTLLVGSSNTKPANGTQKDDEIIILQSPAPSQAVADVAAQLKKTFSSLGYTTFFVSWGSSGAWSLKGKTLISLVELDSSILQNPEEDEFAQVKALILESKSVLWISSLHNPTSALITGLSRVVRNEEPGLSFRTLNANLSSLESADRLAEHVLRVFQSSSGDNEFKVENDIIYISRVVEDDVLNGELNLLDPGKNKTIAQVTLGEAGPLKLCIQNSGLLDSFYFEHDPIPSRDLEADKIEIMVKAASVNFRDVMTAIGQLPGMHLGFDAAGIVLRVGSAVSKFNVGDRIVTLSPGAFRTIHQAKASSCELIPEGLTFEEAATIPVAHGTAWYALVKLAGVISRKGQSILIQAASGGVGQAAIQIAQYAGMEVFATIGSDVKRRLLQDSYRIPDDHIFNSRDLSFVAGVNRMTNGRGVDVILNSLSGEALRQTWYCLAPFGCFIEIGSKDILGNARLDMKPFLQHASFTFFDLKHIAQERPDMLADIMRETFELQRKGITWPVKPIVAYPISEVESAFRLMQTGKHLGKVVLSFADEQQTVSVLNQRRDQSLYLDPNASYILVGGLGGLGRSLSRMLVKNGARKLCFLSRTGAKSLSAQKLVQELQSKGVHVLVQPCDVADAKAVQDSVGLCSKKLGRVRGVIQCAMVLRDTLLRNMTHQDWIECTRPKVHGTWNLHQSLQDVEFFVILSSFAAIFGNRGQGNYAAAGAYQDAIAYFRRAHGLHAVTIDAGIVSDAGVLAEQGMLDSLCDWEVPYGLSENELTNIVKLAIAGDVSGTISPQILTGLATGGSAIAAGIDLPWYLDDAKFAIMAKIGLEGSADKSAEKDASVQARLPEAKSEADAADIVMEALVARVAKMLQTNADEIDTDRFLYSYGIDSLVAIELLNWVLKECKSRITVFDVMAAVPIHFTAKKIALNSSLLSKDLVEV